MSDGNGHSSIQYVCCETAGLLGYLSSEWAFYSSVVWLEQTILLFCAGLYRSIQSILLCGHFRENPHSLSPRSLFPQSLAHPILARNFSAKPNSLKTHPTRSEKNCLAF
ncbi:hypothetical protein CDAR_452461 [Caerostris darwini]|uniref:Cytochrome c biogenesis B n=1 Tax=Caerostris darwini TaxID=1538125 RepID=A0AAV4UKU2_9ARAC|nr:hypothetical protein CDAR_452461 [Caerostris darwini]